ncbi:MAG: DUF4388 domain-containing protein [Proteobacteria bacterium]|nr:DUF4388 domain-containing protein [Pseudomonadota bacterium]
MERGVSSLGIDVDQRLRDQLGLEAEEGLRVLRKGSRTILLGRLGPEMGAALPWDRDLILTADVRAFPLADLLSLVHGAGKSGFLAFSHLDVEKCVYLHRGEVVFATSNQSDDRLGQSLLKAGVVSLEQLRTAERSYTPRNERFGKVLVERGFLTPRELWNGVKFQVEEIVRSLFAYPGGTVHLWEGEVQPDNVVRLSLPTQRLIVEGLESRDELLRFMATLEDTRTSVRTLDGAGIGLSGNEKQLYEAIGRASDFAGACRTAGLDPQSGARTIQLLRALGAVEVERSSATLEFANEPDTDEDAVRQCVELHAKLLAELAAPIVAEEGTEPLDERVARVLEDTAERHSELLDELHFGPGVVLDPDELVSRALRLPRERVRHVCLALGELVAYLEFELKNHPRVEDADRYLEAVEPLRAQLDW